MATRSMKTKKFTKVDKLSILNNMFIKKALSAVTTTNDKKGAIIHSNIDKNKSYVIPPYQFTLGLEKFLKEEGFKTTIFYEPCLNGIKEINGIPVKVKPKGKSYDDRGFIVEIKAEGDTEDLMITDGKYKLKTVHKFFDDINVPASKICLDSLECDIDFRQEDDE